MSLKNFTLSIVIFLSAFMGQSYGQFPPISICGTAEEGQVGDTVCVSFTVENFINVSSFQFGIGFNSTLIRAICPPAYINPVISSSGSGGLLVGCTRAEQGNIRIILDESSGNNVSLTDGDTLFTFCFEVIGDVGRESLIDLSTYNFEIDVVQFDDQGNKFESRTIDFKPGRIRIVANNLTVFTGACDSDSNDGSLWFYAAGGTAPYSYTVNPGGTAGNNISDGERIDITGLAPDLYTIVITDAMGIMQTVTRRINNNPPFEIERDTVIQPSCFTTETGQIQILQLTGGTGSYVYEWSNFINNVETLDRLRTGTYTVTITDRNTRCQIQETYTLAVDTIRFDVMIGDTATCPSSRNGNVIITNITGGTPYDGTQPYTARINSGATFRRISVPHTSQSNLPTGAIRVEIQDAAGCFVDTVIQMPFLYTITVDTVLFQDISCHGANDGALHFRASIPDPQVRFGYIPSSNIMGDANIGGTFTVNNLGPDTYSVRALHFGSGCEVNFPFTITEPDPLFINATITDPDCVNMGAIDVNPTGGTGAYSYAWNPDQGNVSNVMNIMGGMYSLTVTDANNCTKDTTINMNTAGTLNITLQTTDVSCEGRTDGRALVNVVFSGGVIQPFTVFWRDENGVRIQASTTEIGNLASGNYTVEVITADGCSSLPRPFSIGSGSAVNFTSSITPIRCFGGQGVISVTIVGDASGYRYEWRQVGNVMPINTTNSLTAIAGQYTVTVFSPEGCSREESFTLDQPQPLSNVEVDFRTIECFGRLSGGAIITNLISGMVYNWSNNTTGSNMIAVPAGNYWVVGQLNGCLTDTTRFTINQFPILAIDSSRLIIASPTCFGDNNGSISLEAVGGTRMGYRYTWSNGAISNNINNLGAGTYTVTISDSNNCEEEYEFVLTQPNELIATLDLDVSRLLDCNNQDNARLALNVRGGNPGIKTVRWQDGVTVEGNVAIGLSPGNYCATITDNFGCRDTFCYELSAPEPLVGSMNIPSDPLCFGGSTCISVDTISGGTGNRYTFQINNGIRYPIDSCVTVFAGTYVINLIDSSGCSIVTTVTVNQPDPITVLLPEDQSINLGETSAAINGSVIVPSGNDFSSTWLPASVECVNSDCTSMNVSPSETTTYTLSVTDTNGCTGSSQTRVIVRKTRNVFFANIFTPNQDGVNDFFQPVTGLGVERVNYFVIYDRWGNMVFEKSDYVPDPAGPGGWDGTFNGRKLDPAVYVYYCKVLFLDNKEIEYTGSVTMLGSNR